MGLVSSMKSLLRVTSSFQGMVRLVSQRAIPGDLVLREPASGPGIGRRGSEAAKRLPS